MKEYFCGKHGKLVLEDVIIPIELKEPVCIYCYIRRNYHTLQVLDPPVSMPGD
jgi:hypothetical protein